MPQQIQPLQQRALLIRLPEKSRIVEARPQHALVAVPDQSLRIAIGIQHREKMRQQLMVRIFKRKIFLMVAHHRDQHFFRQRQKLRIEAAENHGRKFREVHHRIEQSLVFPPARSGNGARGRIESFANLLLALRPAQNLSRAQSIDISGSGPRNGHARPRDKILCPREIFPAQIPSNSSGIVSPSSIATSQRTGRTKRSFGLRQYIFFGQ